MTKALVVANLKLHGSQKMLEGLLSPVKASLFTLDIDVVVCPTFVHLPFVYGKTKHSELLMGAQDVSMYDEGAHTGEVAASMLAEIGCRYAIIGHSERRQQYHESNEVIAEKHARLISAKLTPIVCIGETLDHYQQGKTHEVLKKQLQDLIKKSSSQDLLATVFAYEPLWAIGSGLTPKSAEINATHRFIRDLLGGATGAKTPKIVYGGSVKAANAKEILALSEVDGVLVGGASLKASEFITICQRADEAQYAKTRS